MFDYVDDTEQNYGYDENHKWQSSLTIVKICGSR